MLDGAVNTPPAASNIASTLCCAYALLVLNHTQNAMPGRNNAAWSSVGKGVRVANPNNSGLKGVPERSAACLSERGHQAVHLGVRKHRW